MRVHFLVSIVLDVYYANYRLWNNIMLRPRKNLYRRLATKYCYEIFVAMLLIVQFICIVIHKVLRTKRSIPVNRLTIITTTIMNRNKLVIVMTLLSSEGRVA